MYPERDIILSIIDIELMVNLHMLTLHIFQHSNFVFLKSRKSIFIPGMLDSVINEPKLSGGITITMFEGSPLFFVNKSEF